jgi:hypothetical protein
LPIHPPPL